MNPIIQQLIGDINMNDVFGKIPDESKSFAEDFRAEEAKWDAAEQRLAMIDERAKELMQEGGRCYPFNPYNIQEAITQSSYEGLLDSVSALRCYSKETGLIKMETFALAYANAQINLICDYWLGVARHVAENELRGR